MEEWGHKESDMTEHTHTHSFLVTSLGIFMYSINIMSSGDRVLLLFEPGFLEFLPPPTPPPIDVARNSRFMLNNSGKSGYPCLVPDLQRNACSFSPLGIMFTVSL